MKKKLLIINGSPRSGSSTEILAGQFARGFLSQWPDAEIVNVRLNDLEIIPCQACGIDPTPMLCIYKDDLYPYLLQLREADFILIASPLYFDSVSAQTKLFIDRCNCFRPPHFVAGKATFADHGILNSKGAYILVGGAREKYDAADRVIGGMFIWCGIEKVGRLVHAHDEDVLGGVASNRAKMEESFSLGADSAKRLR
jgi:multimeric flavodoxin WrbA